MRTNPDHRKGYKYFHSITTRWMDNDVYGHVNNVIYYSWFDTAINQFLIANEALNIENSPVICYVIETQCNYFAPVAFPDLITIGIRVAKLGNSSVRYKLGVFRNEEESVVAQGHFIHVHVNRETRRPVSIPDNIRLLFQSIKV